MKLKKSKKCKCSLEFIAAMQAFGVLTYCGLVALVMWKSTEWFGRLDSYIGPLFVLVLFISSALITGLMVFGRAFILFWEENKKREALKLVAYTGAWLAAFTITIIAGLLLR
ncbi:hypothetical protein ACFL13_01580 [Patescibacteria group bacterium]